MICTLCYQIPVIGYLAFEEHMQGLDNATQPRAMKGGVVNFFSYLK